MRVGGVCMHVRTTTFLLCRRLKGPEMGGCIKFKPKFVSISGIDRRDLSFSGLAMKGISDEGFRLQNSFVLFLFRVAARMCTRTQAKRHIPDILHIGN